MIYFVVAIIIIGLGLWLGLNCDRVLKLRNSIAMAWGKLAEQIGRRHATIQKFVDSLPEEACKQAELVEKLNAARAKAAAVKLQSLKEREAAEDELGDCIGRLLQALQKDEKLADSDGYAKLRDEVLDVEDAVTLARQDHNDLVARFNGQQGLFPVRLFAKQLNLKPLEEFEIEDVFGRYPLQIKGTLPTPRKSIIPGGQAPSDSKESTSQTTG